MICKKKNIIGGVLLIMMLISSFGPVIILQTELMMVQSEIKKMLRQAVPKNDLILFGFKVGKLPGKEEGFEWEHDREFRYKEMMYDVMIIENDGDQLLYYCFMDYREARAYENLEMLVKNKCSGESRNLSRFFSSMKYISPQTETPVFVFVSFPGFEFPGFTSSIPVSACQYPESPPPELS